MTEPELFPVNRENVFNVASQFLDVETRVPSLGLVKAKFDTPSSTAIAVYLAEWKVENADKIAQIKRTPAQLKAYCERLQLELSDISTRYKTVEHELNSFHIWLQGNHPYILTEYDNYGVEE